MTKQEEQKIREAIDSLLPLQDLDEHLKKPEKARNICMLRTT